jgi:hypothetical protein
MIKMTEFTATPRDDLEELSYLGEDEDEIDYLHNGFDLSWSVDMADEIPLQILQDIIDRQKNRDRHPNVTMTVIYNFRGGSGATNHTEVYHRLKMKISEQGFAGRKESVKIGFEAKGRKKSLVPVG